MGHICQVRNVGGVGIGMEVMGTLASRHVCLDNATTHNVGYILRDKINVLRS